MSDMLPIPGTAHRVDVLSHDGVHQRLVEAVCGGQDDVEARVVDRHRSGACQRIEQVERLRSLGPLLVLQDWTSGAGDCGMTGLLLPSLGSQ